MDWEKFALDLVEFALKVGGDELVRALHKVAARRVEEIRPAEGSPTHTDAAIDSLKRG